MMGPHHGKSCSSATSKPRRRLSAPGHEGPTDATPCSAARMKLVSAKEPSFSSRSTCRRGTVLESHNPCIGRHGSLLIQKGVSAIARLLCHYETGLIVIVKTTHESHARAYKDASQNQRMLDGIACQLCIVFKTHLFKNSSTVRADCRDA